MGANVHTLQRGSRDWLWRRRNEGVGEVGGGPAGGSFRARHHSREIAEAVNFRKEKADTM
jgi:hypothetical protein